MKKLLGEKLSLLITTADSVRSPRIYSRTYLSENLLVFTNLYLASIGSSNVHAIFCENTQSWGGGRSPHLGGGVSDTIRMAIRME